MPEKERYYMIGEGRTSALDEVFDGQGSGLPGELTARRAMKPGF
jgi:hypothetical protein